MVQTNSARRKVDKVIEKKFSYKTPFQLVAERRTAVKEANLERIKNVKLKAPRSAAQIVAEIKKARREAADERLKKQPPAVPEKQRINESRQRPKTFEEAIENAKKAVRDELNHNASDSLHKTVEEIMNKGLELSASEERVKELTLKKKYGLSEKEQAELDHHQLIIDEAWEKADNEAVKRNEDEIWKTAYENHIHEIKEKHREYQTNADSEYINGDIDASQHQQKIYSLEKTTDELMKRAVKRYLNKGDIEKEDRM